MALSFTIAVFPALFEETLDEFLAPTDSSQLVQSIFSGCWRRQ
jgi:hypothetical protein